MTDHDDPATPVARPVLRVVKGEPSDHELAALLAVVLTRATPVPTHHNPGWSDRARRMRHELRAGPGGWRTSSWR